MKSTFSFRVLISFILFLVSGITDGTKYRCDYTYNPATRAWYKYHEIPASWNEARLICSLEGAILASPASLEITDAIKEPMIEKSVLEIFTGLSSLFSRGNYYTVDGVPLEKITHDWAPSEPDNKENKENCLAMGADGTLSDVDCDKPLPYVCYRDLEEEIGICGTPDTEYRYDKRTETCYKFHTVPRTFERAIMVCAAEGGHLAIINSDVEATVLRDLFAKYPPGKMVGHFWKDVAFVGFSTWGEGGDWKTIHGQTLKEAGYEKFSAGEPNNSTTGEYCGAIYRSALFNDLWCTNDYAFICEKKTDYPAVCDN